MGWGYAEGSLFGMVNELTFSFGWENGRRPQRAEGQDCGVQQCHKEVCVQMTLIFPVRKLKSREVS